MKVIALEEHFTTQKVNDKVEHRQRVVNDRSIRTGHNVVEELLSLGESRLKAMDAAGIDMQILSLGAPGLQAFTEAETSVPLAIDANDILFETVQRHPTRYAGFAALPTCDPAASAKELERCVKKLGFVGTMINGHTQGSFLDDKKYWPIFEAAEALDAAVYLHPRDIHPAVMKAYFEGYEEISSAAWGFGMETALHFLRIVLSGVFDAYPKLKFILGHLGEGLPFWIPRIHEHIQLQTARRGLKKTPEQYLNENLYVTCSGHFSNPAILCTILQLGIDRVMFSADWPFESNKTAAAFLHQLPISHADKEKIAHGNVEKLLNLKQ